jgi:hypothetical protein
MRPSLLPTFALAAMCGCVAPKTPGDFKGYSPPVVLVLQNIQIMTNNCHVALLEMRNVSEGDMWFTGNSRGQPDYCVEREFSIGGWDDYMGGRFCGNDMGRWRLAAGASTNFPVPIWPEREHRRRYRVGVVSSPFESPKPSTPVVTYWSEPISLEP